MLFPWKNLNSQAQRALVCHVLLALGLALADTFVNVYLFRLQGGAYRPVALFQIGRAIFVPLGFVLATGLAKRSSTAWAYRAGILTYELFYLTVLCLGPRSAHLAFALGCLQGLAMGIYWLGWGVLSLELSHDHERDRFLGSGLLGIGLVGLVGSPLAGWLLSHWVGTEGYFWLFVITSLVFLAAAIQSWPLRTAALPKSGSLLRLLRARFEPAWKAALWACYLAGLRDGILLFLVGLLVYQVSGSEKSLGAYSGSMAGLALVGAWLASRLCRPSNRLLCMLWGGGALCLLTLVLAAKLNFTLLLVYGVGSSLLTPLYQIPLSAAQFKVISDSRRLNRRRADGVTLREFPIALGRISGNLYFLLFVQNASSQWLRTLLVLLAGVPLVITAIFRPFMHESSQKEQSQDPVFARIE